MKRVRWAAMGVVLICGAARADIIPGVDYYIEHKTTALVGHKPTADEARKLPAELKDMVIVDRVVRGAETRRYVPVAKGTEIAAGQKGGVVIWLPGEVSPMSLPRSERRGPAESIEFWGMDNEEPGTTVEAGVPRKATPRWAAKPAPSASRAGAMLLEEKHAWRDSSAIWSTAVRSTKHSPPAPLPPAPTSPPVPARPGSRDKATSSWSRSAN